MLEGPEPSARRARVHVGGRSRVTGGEADVNGDGAADMQVLVKANPTLAESDFVL